MHRKLARRLPPFLLCLVATAAGCRDDGPGLDEAAEHFIEAQQALGDGDTAKAMQELNASIELRPDPWAYYQRAKLYADAGDEAAAQRDCAAGLELAPRHANLKWLHGELEKPVDKRFQGASEQPPSATK